MVESIIKSYDIWTNAQGVKSKGRVRSIDNISFEGIAQLRKLILELAVRGKLVAQNAADEPASELIKKIKKEKETLVSDGFLKKEKALPQITDEENTFNLPKNWSWVRLGEVGSTNIGLTYAPKNVSTDGTLVLRSSNIKNGEIDLSDSVRVNLEIKETVLVNRGDLLICARNGSRSLVGKCAIIKSLPEPMAFGAFMAIYRSSLNEYVKVFLDSPIYRRSLDDVETTTINQITQDNLKNTAIPLPPIAEQHRIVAKVDELMALCDELEKEKTTNLKTHQTLVSALLQTLTATKDAGEVERAWHRLAPHFDTLFCTEDSIDQLKQTILQLAVMGRLVKQNPADEPASVLLKKVEVEREKLIKEGKIKKEKPLPQIKDDEKPFALPHGWEWSRLGQVTTYGFTEKVEPGDVPDDTWVLELEDIEKISSKLLQKVRVAERRYQSSKNKFLKGDVVYGKLRPYLDKVLIADEDGICTTEMMPVRGYWNITPSFLRLVLKSTYFIEYATNSTHGMNLPRLGTDKARLALFPVTSKNEQKRIVAKVEELMALCDNLKLRLLKSQEIQNTLSKTIVENAVA